MQSSFSVVDQIMTGQLGSISIAGIGLFSAFVLHLPIAAIYFVLSMEECVRVVISLARFRKKNWMQKL